jgi:hypothetical protein
VPQYLCTLRSCFPPVGAFGASRVLLRISSCMPRPEDSGGPPPPRQNGCFVLPSGTLKPSASATSLSRSCTSTSGCASPLRPTGCSVYASPVLFTAFQRLRHRRKTRYGWVASPYPTGTSTPQEAPSLSRRDNVDAHRLPGRRLRPSPSSVPTLMCWETDGHTTCVWRMQRTSTRVRC